MAKPFDVKAVAKQSCGFRILEDGREFSCPYPVIVMSTSIKTGCSKHTPLVAEWCPACAAVYVRRFACEEHAGLLSEEIHVESSDGLPDKFGEYLR